MISTSSLARFRADKKTHLSETKMGNPIMDRRRLITHWLLMVFPAGRSMNLPNSHLPLINPSAAPAACKKLRANYEEMRATANADQPRARAVKTVKEADRQAGRPRVS